MEESGDVVICDMSDKEPTKPYIGQQFESEELAYDFYNGYGGRQGFAVRKGYFHKHKMTGRIRDRKYVCKQQGFKQVDKRRFNVKNPREDTRCGCEAEMGIVFDLELAKYVVRSFAEEHNHDLQTSQTSFMLRSQRKFTRTQAIVADLARQSGLSIRHTFEYMGNEVGGVENLGFIKDDMKRYLQTKRQRSMAYGEAAAVLEYFQVQRANNPCFYSAYLLDNEQQITNIFWADARMVLDYSDFGDVITFDTTYKTNNSERPCAVFAGFNHYRKTVIFSGAFLYDETADSFEWLFKTFLHCMLQKKPKTIFTDQAQAIAIGLSRVMPGTRHCLCTWHLTENLRKHYGRFLKEGIVEMWHDCMHTSMGEEQFDELWKEFLNKYGVANDVWFHKTYELRKKWGDTFLKNTLTLGMASTQLSERLNASLKEWLRADLHIVEFFEHFHRVVNIKRYKELKAEFEARQKFYGHRIKLNPMLNDASKVYTKPIFDKFHIEYDEAHGLILNENEDGSLYRVAGFGDEVNVFEVIACKESESVTCSCAMFEMVGYLCCHCLKVLDRMNIKTIPKQYILSRWTKGAKSDCVLDFNGLKIEVEPHRKMSQCYHSLCPNLIMIAARASECDEATKLVPKTMSELAVKVAEICINNNIDPDASGELTSKKVEVATTGTAQIMEKG